MRKAVLRVLPGSRQAVGLLVPALLLVLAVPLAASDSLCVTLVGHCETPGVARDVFVQGDYAYMADDSTGMRVISIADPTTPMEVGFWRLRGVHVHDVQIAGDYAFLSVYPGPNWYAFRVIDVSVPANPVQAGSCAVQGDNLGYGVCLSGNYAWMASNAGGLQVIDITPPTAPSRIGGYREINWYAKAVSTLDGYAFIATATEGRCTTGLHIVDVRNPSNPVPAGNCMHDKRCEDVCVVDTFAYVVGANGLDVINASDKQNPQVAGHCHVGTGANGVFVKDTFAYVALSNWNNARLSVVDVSDPAAPSEKGYYVLSNCTGYGVFVEDTLIYLATGEQGLHIFRYTGPAAVEEGTTKRVTATLSIGPNPFRTETEIGLSDCPTTSWSASVYDCSGHLVRTLPTIDRRSPTAVWNGRDNAGRKVSAGSYFVVLAGPNRTRVGQATVTR